MSYNTIGKYALSDYAKTKYISLSSLLDNILASINFMELDAKGKEIIVKTLQELIYHTSLFACTFYLTNEFNFYPGLENLLTSIVQVGVSNNIQF